MFSSSETTFKKTLLSFDIKTDINFPLKIQLSLSVQNSQKPLEKDHTVSTAFLLGLKEMNLDSIGWTTSVQLLKLPRQPTDTLNF